MWQGKTIELARTLGINTPGKRDDSTENVKLRQIELQRLAMCVLRLDFWTDLEKGKIKVWTSLTSGTVS
jgi:hypothetical protein